MTSEEVEQNSGDVKNTACERGLWSSLGSFLVLGLVVLILSWMVFWFFFGEKFLFSLKISWTIGFVSGILSIMATHCMKRRYGINVATILFGTFIRSGIPIVAVLVFIFILDNNILIEVIVGVTLFHMLFMPYEVKLSLPKKVSCSRKGTDDSTGSRS